ncbi:MAG: sirohydrochlorin chelatase [Pseudomonadota bacterium]
MLTDEAIAPGGTVFPGEKLGIMICGHGSRNKFAVDEFAKLAIRLRECYPGIPVEYGYLEFATPVIRTGLDRLREQGVTRIKAVPGMLFAAGHAKNDIPSVLNEYAREFGVNIDYGKELGIDSRMIRAAGARIEEAIASAPDKVAPEDTLLVVVGRGSSDPDANSNISKVMRLLWEGFGFGWGEVAYSGVTFPLVEPALEKVARLGFKRIVVFPYFLFTGVLIKRIYENTDFVAAKHPEIEFVKAGYLNDHPLVIETFQERLEQIDTGENVMNCALCKYRAQVLGFEDQVGLPQESHHHHVEGIGTVAPEDCPCKGDCNGFYCRQGGVEALPAATHDHHHHHDHAHGHSHDHAHTHHPYPHANHPLGPKTLRPVSAPDRVASSEGVDTP